MGRGTFVLMVLAGVCACGRSGGGGDRNVVDCNRLGRRITSCAAELAIAQDNVDHTGGSPSEMLANILAGPIGLECPGKQGKIDDAPAVNECVDKADCAEMAECFARLTR